MNIDGQFLITSPLFEPLLPTLLQFKKWDHPPGILELNQFLDVEGIKFVPQETKSDCFELSYEPRIFLKGEVQTRENSWHDFFNALVWRHFLNSKRTINRRHYHLQKHRYPSKHRSSTEDMLTLFDENGAVVIVNDPLFLDLIREHHWHELFWRRRENLYQHIKVLIFGHALYEKALRPYVGLTALCLMFVAQGNSQSFVDTLIADYLQSNENLTPSVLSPLPILGLPGWWPANNDEQFYNNQNYFRPKALTPR